MSSPVAELDAGLNAMLVLKPPGVSGTQIKTLTNLCVNNVQSESVLIQKIFTHFKKTPGTHKLGVLYVVDSVTRRWLDQAKQQGQTVNSSAVDGTYAAGVHRVTELIPVLMNDIVQSAPPEQKEKIKKLVDIWEKGQTFPMTLIESFKQKLNAAPKNESTTPVGSPPPGPGLPGLPGSHGASAAATQAPAPGAPSAIMEALAKMARQNMSAPPSNTGLPPPDSTYGAAPVQSTPVPQAPLPVTQSQPAYPYSAAPPPVNPAAMPYTYPGQMPVPGQVPVAPVTASSQPGVFPGAAAMASPMPGMDPAVAQQVQLIKLLVDQGIPADKIPALLSTMQSSFPSMAGAGGAAPMAPQGQMPYGGAWPQQEAPRPDESRDRYGYGGGNGAGGVRSPNRFQRSRSRSPRRWDARDSPRGRDRGFGAFGHDSPARGFEDDRRGRGADYRQRSPPRRGHSPQPPYDRDPSVKWVEYDRSIPSGHIRVLSRTLFVGGVTCSEGELRGMFNQHGKVQTCIVNKEKRHAFVKMLTRRDAVAAKEAMENSQYRTRWGVGFGPRDCSDYSSGISVIPINKLTEADRKWMLTADFGGSGGRPIETGMVVEEPDIEIGAGVSSKAISRRMQTDKGGRHGPKSSRGGDDEDGNLARWRRGNKDGRHPDRPEDQGPAAKADPDVPAFPYGIATGPNGMPIFPPNFSFPAPNQ